MFQSEAGSAVDSDSVSSFEASFLLQTPQSRGVRRAERNTGPSLIAVDWITAQSMSRPRQTHHHRPGTLVLFFFFRGHFFTLRFTQTSCSVCVRTVLFSLLDLKTWLNAILLSNATTFGVCLCLSFATAAPGENRVPSLFAKSYFQKKAVVVALLLHIGATASTTRWDSR